jgi:hypothetical protein
MQREDRGQARLAPARNIAQNWTYRLLHTTLIHRLLSFFRDSIRSSSILRREVRAFDFLLVDGRFVRLLDVCPLTVSLRAAIKGRQVGTAGCTSARYRKDHLDEQRKQSQHVPSQPACASPGRE